MSLISATFGVSWKVSTVVAGIIFWAAAGSTAASIVKAALLAVGGGLGAGAVVMLVGMGVGYLVSKYYTQSNLSMW